MTFATGRPVAPRRAGRAARAGDARSGRRGGARALARRRRLPLDVQPHRAVPRRPSTRSAPSRALEALAGEPLDGVLYRLHEDDGGGAPLPRRRRARLARPRRRRDPRPGARRVRGGRRRARLLDRVFRQALGVGKRVRTETAIGESPASVSSAAAALAAQVFGDLRGRRVLLVGAGRIGELAASNLASRGAEIAFVANRTVETARELAHRFGGAAIGLDELGATLGEVDVVLSSTSSPDAVVRAADVPAQAASAALLHRHRSPARPRSGDRRARRLLPLRHRRPRGGRRRDADRPARRGRARRAARRRGGRAVPRVARVARRRAGDRVAARARGGDQERRAREGAA